MPNSHPLSRRVLMLVPAASVVMAAVSLGLVPTATGDDRASVPAPEESPVVTTTVTTSVPPSTTAPTAPAATVPSTTAPPTPPAASTAVPPYGQATAYGCGAALAYLRAYAAPGFALVCPGDAAGHQGMTCFYEAPCGPGVRLVAVAVPCPAVYMNEAHNSWVLQHEVEGTPIPDGNPAIDPYGHC